MFAYLFLGFVLLVLAVVVYMAYSDYLYLKQRAEWYGDEQYPEDPDLKEDEDG